MSSQRYERVRIRQPTRLRTPSPPYRTAHPPTPNTNIPASQVAAQDADDHATMTSSGIPSSPPPSFRSRASSRRTSREDAPDQSEEERNLHDAFDAPSDDESDDRHGGPRDQRRLIASGERTSTSDDDEDTPANTETASPRPTVPQRRVTEIPIFAPTPTGGRASRSAPSNDGVFANITAKPRPGDDLEEKPPTYEQAAADATPPYWETTVLSPYSTTGNPDDVFVDGLLVGSLFSFVWNALISMSFQLIGFLLTYLLHTTHAAKHGSRAGLGITLVQYGFSMRYSNSKASPGGDPGIPGGGDGMPDDANAHDFDPNQIAGGAAEGLGGLSTSDWLAYVLMIVGWFILIRAVSDFLRARRQEQLVRSSPDRGLGVAVVAEGEAPETSV